MAGTAGLAEAVSEAGTAGGSTAFRLGLIAWRIAGILTVLRCFENGEAPGETIEADPRDVTTALRIMHTARAHALAVLASLPQPARPRVGPAAKADREAMVKELHAQGQSMRCIADQTGVPKSTVERWLK